MDFGNAPYLAKLFLLVALILACAATDVCTRRVPNSILLPALIASLFLSSLADGLAGLVDSLAGLAIGLLILMPLHVLGRMGAGDIKLLGVVGSILGAWGATVAGLATMMAGAILGIAYMIWLVVRPERTSLTGQEGQRNADEAMVRGGGTSFSAVRTAEVPYAVAVAAGTFAAIVYLDLLVEAGIV